MFKNSSKIIFLFSMFLGTLITISSNSWLGVWMGLEINLLSFIPLMIESDNLMTTEASLKYFLTQAFASSLLLFSMILLIMFDNLHCQFQSINSSLLMSVPLMIKMGMAPFHFWFPSVMEGISWSASLILMTWQKIAPMVIISYLNNYNFFIIFIIISAIVGAIGGLNQTSLQKIMAFSSINHLSWMLTALLFNEYLWILYFIVYCFMSFSLVLLFNQFNLFSINQVFSMFNYSSLIKFSFLISFLSLAGLPPFLGFLPKWMLIQSLTQSNQFLLILTLILMSLVTMYFYLRVCYSAVMLNYTETSWNSFSSVKIKLHSNNMTFMFITINSLFTVIFLIFIFL